MPTINSGVSRLARDIPEPSYSFILSVGSPLSFQNDVSFSIAALVLAGCCSSAAKVLSKCSAYRLLLSLLVIFMISLSMGENQMEMPECFVLSFSQSTEHSPDTFTPLACKRFFNISAKTQGGLGMAPLILN